MQLPLSLTIRDDATFENYFSGDNSALVQSLQDLLAGHGEQFIYLWGAPGVGCSHLLQACCHAASDRGLSVVYLPLAENKELVPEVLPGLESMDLVCIDDVQTKLNDEVWEEALFHFYNRAVENKTRLIVAGDCPPRQLQCRLPDLQSRLSVGLTFQVLPLDEAQTCQALQLRASHRGLELSDEVANYLLKRYPRNMQELFTILVWLDHASLAKQRRLTIPFVKSIIEQ